MSNIPVTENGGVDKENSGPQKWSDEWFQTTPEGLSWLKLIEANSAELRK